MTQSIYLQVNLRFSSTTFDVLYDDAEYLYTLIMYTLRYIMTLRITVY